MRWSILALIPMLAFVVGCGLGGPELVPVSGQVLVDGKPVPYGIVRFIPKEGRPALGQLDSQGRFELMTDEQKGCIKGEHAVEVSAVESISEYENKEHAPSAYASAETSGLTENITGPITDLKIELSSSKKAPANTSGYSTD